MRPRVVFLHGFTQTHHHWHAVAHRLEARLDGATVGFVDLPGHGLAGDDATPLDEAGDVLARTGGEAVYVGYSMGGRFALRAAVDRPDLVRGLVLIGATPGIVDDDERRARREADDALADRIEHIGVEAFVDEWLAGPLFAGLPDDPDDRRHRLRNGAPGLATSLRTSGTGAQTPLWDRLAEVTVPTLVLAGARDAKFTEIGRRIAAAMPDARFESIPDAGHAAHTEQPAATLETILRWLQ